MIVVDTNVIAYLFIPGEYTDRSKALLMRDSQWISPLLWRSEFRNILATYIRQGYLKVNDASSLMNEAESFMSGSEYAVTSDDVLSLVAESICSAYDCEFVALAKKSHLALFTTDKKILKAFPDVARSLINFK